MNWTEKDIQNLKPGSKPKSTTRKIPRKSAEKAAIRKTLWYLNREKIIPEYVEELKFHPVRKFRFDWAIPSLKIGIEYEGVISKKSRHTTINGYTTDCVKYNLATTHGWKILRYTAKNYRDLAGDLKKIIQVVQKY